MDTFLSLSAWLVLSGIWDMLISFCSNIAKTEATTACSWSRFYFIEEFDASSTTTCSNVIFPMIHKRHFSRYTDNTCILLSFWERLCKELSVSLSHNLCFSYMSSLGMWTYELVYACSCTHGVHNLIWGCLLPLPFIWIFFFWYFLKMEVINTAKLSLAIWPKARRSTCFHSLQHEGYRHMLSCQCF